MQKYFPTRRFLWGGVWLIFIALSFFLINHSIFDWCFTFIIIMIGILSILMPYGKIQYVGICDHYLLFKNFNKVKRVNWHDIERIYNDKFIFFKVYHIFTNLGKLQLFGYHDEKMIREIVRRAEHAYIDTALKQLK